MSIPLESWISITRSIPVKRKTKFKLLSFTDKLSVRDNRLLVFVNFHFIAGVICMIKDKITNGYEIIEMINWSVKMRICKHN